MATKLISELTALGATPAATDLIEIETAGGLPRKATYAELVPLEDVTALDALTAPAVGDLLVIRDINDLTDGADGTDKKITALALTGFTAASASGPAQLDLAEDTDNGAHKVSLKAPASVTADVVATLPNATYDMGAVYLFEGKIAAAEAHITADNSTGRAVGVRLPCDMTITNVQVGMNAQTGNDTNYWTIDVRYLPIAGDNDAGISLFSAPPTTQSTGGHAAWAGGLTTLDNQLVTLTPNQNLTRTKGDLIYLVFTKAASAANIASNRLDLVVEGTRR